MRYLEERLAVMKHLFGTKIMFSKMHFLISRLQDFFRTKKTVFCFWLINNFLSIIIVPIFQVGFVSAFLSCMDSLWAVCLFAVCLFVCLSVCPFVRLFAHSFLVYLFVCLFEHLFICLFVCLYIKCVWTTLAPNENRHQTYLKSCLGQ